MIFTGQMRAEVFFTVEASLQQVRNDEATLGRI